MATMTRIVIALSLAACPGRATNKSQLVTNCSSSAECKTDSGGCIYCFNGHCSCTLPAEPLPPPPGGTTP